MTIKQLLALACAAAPATSLVAPRSSPVKTALRAWGPDWDLQPESTCIHGGWAPDPATTARAVPVYRTGPYQFESTEKAAKLFALAELGNIYSRRAARKAAPRRAPRQCAGAS